MYCEIISSTRVAILLFNNSDNYKNYFFYKYYNVFAIISRLKKQYKILLTKRKLVLKILTKLRVTHIKKLKLNNAMSNSIHIKFIIILILNLTEKLFFFNKLIFKNFFNEFIAIAIQKCVFV